MDGGVADEAGGTRAPAPPPDLPAPPLIPSLPRSNTEGMPALADHRAPSTPPTSAWYRSDQQRFKSVYRRANPWHRRLLRGVIGLSILGAVGIGLYIGGSELNDYFNRDRLPQQGATPPAFRSSSFQLTGGSPGLEGTLTIDADTGAFEFIGSADGRQSGATVISPDGEQAFVRSGQGDWQVAVGDLDVSLRRVIPYLLAVDDIDDIFDNQMRRGYVELDDKTVLGVDEDARDTYVVRLMASELSVEHPLSWVTYQEQVVPAANPAPVLTITFTVDQSEMVMAFDDQQNGWSWQRLAYTSTAFVPDPKGEIQARVDAAPEPATTSPPAG